MSLFSFQDIITAITGILILVALILALSVIIQGAESEVEIVHADDQMLAYRAELQEQVESMKQLSSEIASESATWSSSTPDELAQKIESASKSNARTREEITKAKTELSKEKARLREVKNDSTVVEMRDAFKQSEKAIVELVDELQDLKSTNRVVYNIRDKSKVAWLVEISGNKILAAPIASATKPKVFNSAQAFNKFATNLPSSDQYFVLLLKPSGTPNYDIIKPFLSQEDYDIGTELIGENQIVVDPVKGASF